jgi:amidase
MEAVPPSTVVEQEVRAAVARYEAALAADDLAELDALFAPGETTVRADGAGVLVSHAAISAYRRGRGGAPARTVTELHVLVHGPGVATALAETLRPDGTRGLQTQVWEKGAPGWQIRIAHRRPPRCRLPGPPRTPSWNGVTPRSGGSSGRPWSRPPAAAPSTGCGSRSRT